MLERELGRWLWILDLTGDHYQLVGDGAVRINETTTDMKSEKAKDTITLPRDFKFCVSKLLLKILENKIAY